MKQLLLVVGLIFTYTGLLAHPVSLNWVKLKIEDGKVSVQYRILAEDLVYFYRPEPDQYYNYSTQELKVLAKKHGDAIARHFNIIDQDENVLMGRVISVYDDSLPREPVNLMDLMKYDIVYQLAYEEVPSDWNKLFIEQGIGDGLPVVTFLSATSESRVLLDQAELADQVRFELLRYGKNDIANPSKLTSSYFTTTHSGIRHELTIPTDLLYSLMGTSGSNEITQEQLYRYFSKYNQVQVTGNTLVPTVEQVNHLALDSKSRYTYLDIYYHAAKRPDYLSIRWSDFNWEFRWLESNIQIEDSLYRHTFSRFQPEFNWIRESKPERN
jgi:hypothetical protein